MSSPSAEAIEAGAHYFNPQAFERPDIEHPTSGPYRVIDNTLWKETARVISKSVLDAAHDPELGLGRSVCLRDVLEALRNHDRPEDDPDWYLHISYAVELEDAANFLVREFAAEA